MAALPEITLRKHEASYRGGGIIPATHVPAETSLSNSRENYRLCHVNLGPNFVSSTQPRKPDWCAAFAKKPDPPKTSSFNIFQSCVCEPPDLQLLCQARSHRDDLQQLAGPEAAE